MKYLLVVVALIHVGTSMAAQEAWNCMTEGTAAEVVAAEGHDGAGNDSDCKGRNQSPIHIQLTDTVYEPGLATFGLRYIVSASNETGSDASTTITNTGHTIQLRVAEVVRVAKSGMIPRGFTLEQVHFHWGSADDRGSEHRINNQSKAMEIHLVHWNHVEYTNFSAAAVGPRGLGVVAVLVKVAPAGVGTSSDTLRTVAMNLVDVREPGTSTTVAELNGTAITGLLPNQTNFVRYNGSLTTEPCTENVLWNVITDPILISAADLEKFRVKPLQSNNDTQSNNYRPPKPVNRRRVERSFDPQLTAAEDETSTSGTEQTTLRPNSAGYPTQHEARCHGIAIAVYFVFSFLFSKM